MNWTVYRVLWFCCFATLCDGSSGSEVCVCDGNTGKSCSCNDKEDVDKTWVYLIVIAAILTVGVATVIVGCCLRKRKLKDTQKKGDLEKFEHAYQIDDTSLQYVFPPSVVGLPKNYTTLPYYHPETRNSSITPPQPYSIL